MTTHQYLCKKSSSSVTGYKSIKRTTIVCAHNLCCLHGHVWLPCLSWLHDAVEASKASITSGQFELEGKVCCIHVNSPPSRAQAPADWRTNKLLIVHRDAAIQSEAVTCTVLTLRKVKVHQPEVCSRTPVIHPSTWLLGLGGYEPWKFRGSKLFTDADNWSALERPWKDNSIIIISRYS